MKKTKIDSVIFSGDEVEVNYTQLVGENSRARFKMVIPKFKYFLLYDHGKIIDYIEETD